MFLFSIAGFCAIFYNKRLNDAPHFTSWHGLFGLASCLALALQVVVGVARVGYFRTSIASLERSFLGGLRIVKPVHGWLALVVYTLAISTIYIGLYSTWAVNNISVSMLTALRFALLFNYYFISKQIFAHSFLKTIQEIVIVLFRVFLDKAFLGQRVSERLRPLNDNRLDQGSRPQIMTNLD